MTEQLRVAAVVATPATQPTAEDAAKNAAENVVVCDGFAERLSAIDGQRGVWSRPGGPTIVDVEVVDRG